MRVGRSLGDLAEFRKDLEGFQALITSRFNIIITFIYKQVEGNTM